MTFSTPTSGILLIASVMTASVATVSAEPPIVKLDVPAEFQHSLAINHFKKGDDVLHIDWNPTGAQAPMTQYTGDWPLPQDPRDTRPWTIDVYNDSKSKVAAAYAHAKNGYEADLDEFVDFLIPPSPLPPGYSPPQHALAYFFARYERKHFTWGNAVSFLSQETQDTSVDTPDNGRLTYEVWGVTKDGRHTVVARVRVGHPKLETGGEDVSEVTQRGPDWERAWDDASKRSDFKQMEKLGHELGIKEMAELKNHPHTKLVETCNPNEFEPSLPAFDRMLDSLVVQ